MYKNRLYNVEGLLHPGGMFIIQHVIGQEISRYIHGAYALEITKAERYNHSIYAQRLLEEMFMAEPDLSKVGLLKPLNGEKTNVPANWRFQKSSVLSEDTSVF